MSVVTGKLANVGDVVVLVVPADTQSVTVQLQGVATASVVIEDSFDDITYSTIGTMTNPGIVNFPIGVPGGKEQVQVFRARAAGVSGTVNVTLTTYPASATVQQFTGTLNLATFPLPENASEEAGGNLERLTNLMEFMLLTLQAINLTLGNMSNSYIDPQKLFSPQLFQ